jgi:hypothetical protein
MGHAWVLFGKDNVRACQSRATLPRLWPFLPPFYGVLQVLSTRLHVHTYRCPKQPNPTTVYGTLIGVQEESRRCRFGADKSRGTRRRGDREESYIEWVKADVTGGTGPANLWVLPLEDKGQGVILSTVSASLSVFRSVFVCSLSHDSNGQLRMKTTGNENKRAETDTLALTNSSSLAFDSSGTAVGT